MELTTFGILDEFNALFELMAQEEFDEDTGELIDNSETAKQLLEEMESKRDEKLDNIEYIKREFKMREDALQEEIKRLTERKHSFSKKQEHLKSLQDFLLQGEKLKTDKFTFFYGSSKAVEIEDENLIPSEYIVTSFSINKSELSKVLKAGGDVAGASIKETTSLRVR